MKPLNEMTGLEYVQAMMAGETPYPSMYDVIPMRCVVAEHGYAKFMARAETQHANPAGPVHGGHQLPRGRLDQQGPGGQRG